MNLQIKQVKHIASGKVRDIYSLDDQHLALVTTDRISAYDVVLNDQIPDKGRVLNQLTVFWLEKFKNLTSTHLVDITDKESSALLNAIGNP